MSTSGALNSAGKRTSFFIALFFLIALIILSFFVRERDFSKTTGVQNLEATYHVLLTAKALNTGSIANNWLLPSVSLGGAADKNIPWGATQPTHGGDYVYTSFTSPGFVVPYLAFKVLAVEASQRNLAIYNAVLGAIVSLALYALLVKVLECAGYDRNVAVGGAFLGTIVSIFSKEVLQSHGLVYWIHSFYQLILVSCLAVLFAYLNRMGTDDKQSKKYAWCLVAAVFFGAWTEWTGYVFGFGVAVLFWFGIGCQRPQRSLAVKLILALVLAVLVTLIHYGMAVGFETAAKAFARRFIARSAATGTLVELLQGYALSYGLFAVIAVLVGVLAFFGIGKVDENSTARNRIGFLFLAATIPLVENFVMMQHAGQFSFDRLKFLFPLAFVIAFAFARYSKYPRILLAVAVMFAGVNGYSSYRADLLNYAKWESVDVKNKNFVDTIKKSVNLDCAVLLSDTGVRGYSNLLFNRGIHEFTPATEMKNLMDKHRACAAVYLEAEWTFIDLPHYTQALILKPDGSTLSIDSQ